MTANKKAMKKTKDAICLRSIEGIQKTETERNRVTTIRRKLNKMIKM